MEGLSSDQLKMIATAFKEMDVKPNLDSTAEFKDWMMQYAMTQVVKDEQDDQGDTPSTTVTTTSASNTTTTTTSASNTTTTTTSATNTTTTSTSSTYIPKIATFSGDGTKQDTAYELWKFEMECLVKEQYKESVVRQSIRRSLKGDAGKVVMRLGTEAKVAEILENMESVYGTIEREKPSWRSSTVRVKRKVRTAWPGAVD